MAGLTHIEKQKLETELRMSGGYVLDFSNRTFEEFFREVVDVDIYDKAFDLTDLVSKSKANRMRGFWRSASDAQLRLLLRGILDGWDIYSRTPIVDSARMLIQGILKRLDTDGSSCASPVEPEVIAQDISKFLISRLVDVSNSTPQERGFRFEKFLKELFEAYHLSSRASFRLTGEQIDGSFVMHNETYLLEAKWQSAPIGAADLHTFEGKLSQKATWSRGLFVSHSGFSSEGLEAFGRGKRLVCMDGFDLSEMLRLKLPFVDVMQAKVRRAAETGSTFTSVRDLFA